MDCAVGRRYRANGRYYSPEPFLAFPSIHASHDTTPSPLRSRKKDSAQGEKAVRREQTPSLLKHQPAYKQTSTQPVQPTHQW
jgi:hypothetical protein